MLKINFWFFVILSIMLLYDKNNIIACSLFSAFFHELGHLIFIILTKQRIKSFTFNSCVLNINLQNNLINNHQKLLISCGGCLFNFILIIIGFWFSLKKLIIVNFSLFLFNILPIYGLDGYDIIICTNITDKKINIISNVLNFLLLIIGIVLVFYNNISILFISVYLYLIKKRSY